MIILWMVVFIISLAALIKSASVFTKYSEQLGLLLGLSSFVIGATIIAIGTSLPELVSALYAVVEAGETTFVADSIIGSNVANALLILGLGTVVARKLKVHTSLIDVHLPFFFSSMMLFVFFIWDGIITWREATLLLIFFIAFVLFSAKAKTAPEDSDEMSGLRQQYKTTNGIWKNVKVLKYSAIIMISMTIVAISAKYFIDSILMLSELFGVSSSLLTITVVSLGTSLPEILTSLVAVRMGNHGMAIGNVIGSNTFNIALVGSLPALIGGSLVVSQTTLIIGIPFLVVATLFAIFSTIDSEIELWEGIAMLFLYGVFVGNIIGFL